VPGNPVSVELALVVLALVVLALVVLALDDSLYTPVAEPL